MKVTHYFLATRVRPDRAIHRDDWIMHVVNQPTHETLQLDGRIRRWAQIDEAAGRWLRVVLLEDGETIHNAFFDRNFAP